MIAEISSTVVEQKSVYVDLILSVVVLSNNVIIACFTKISGFWSLRVAVTVEAEFKLIYWYLSQELFFVEN